MIVVKMGLANTLVSVVVVNNSKKVKQIHIVNMIRNMEVSHINEIVIKEIIVNIHILTININLITVMNILNHMQMYGNLKKITFIHKINNLPTPTSKIQ